VVAGGECDPQGTSYPDRWCSPNGQSGDGPDDLINRRQPNDHVRAGQLTLIDGDDGSITPGDRATSEYQVVINLVMFARQGFPRFMREFSLICHQIERQRDHPS
jgi:hypothetical protein